MTETMIIAEAEVAVEAVVEALEVNDGQQQQQHQHQQKKHQKRIVIEDDDNELSGEEEVEKEDDDRLPDNMNSSRSTKNKDKSKNKNCVRFGTVTVRNYGMTLGTNPATSIGPPVCLEWDYEQLQTILIDDYETTKNFGRIVQIENKNRSPREFYLNYYKRRGILERAGFTEHDFTSMERQIKYERLQRKITLYQSFPVLYLKSWKIASAQRKSKTFVRNYRKEHPS